MMRLALPLLLAVFCSACSSLTSLPPLPEGALPARHYDVRITTWDGLQLKATVYQPALAAGQSAPLVIHTNAFGLKRLGGDMDVINPFMSARTVAKRLWKKGDWVLSYSSRGFDGVGKINVVAPDKEIRDVSTVIDWAEKNIPRLQRNAKGDPMIGMMGVSYGAGTTLIAASTDPRIDAIVPYAGWYNIADSLAPSDVPKGAWIKLLYYLGNIWEWDKLSNAYTQPFKLAKKGIIEPGFIQANLSHGLSYYCEQGRQPEVNALIVQGYRDTLFNGSQGVQAFDCLRRSGKSVHLVMQSGGHMIPLHQHSYGLPVFYTDKRIQCGATAGNTNDLVTAWLYDTLAGKTPPAVPPVCVSSHQGWGVALNQWPAASVHYVIPPVALSGSHSGSWHWVNWTRAAFASLRTDNSLKREFHQPHDSGTLAPAFIPLLTATQVERYAGTPEVLLHASHALKHPVVLAALVIRHTGSAQLQRVDDQIAPVRMDEKTSLPALVFQLKPGDQLGLSLFGKDVLFDTLPLDFGKGVKMSGELWLPTALSSRDVLHREKKGE